MEMTNKDVLLGVNELEVSFFTHAGEVKAVRKVSYDLKYGEAMGIVGESGSGKSVSSYAYRLFFLQYVLRHAVP